MHRMHIFCWREWRSKAFQQLNGLNVGAEDAMAGYMRIVCSGGEAVVVGGRNSSSKKRAKTFCRSPFDFELGQQLHHVTTATLTRTRLLRVIEIWD